MLNFMLEDRIPLPCQQHMFLLTDTDSRSSFRPTRGGRRALTDAVQAVQRHGLEGPPHHGILLQHLVEVVHRQRVQSAVVVGAHAGRAPAARQQADLCECGETIRREITTETKTSKKWEHDKTGEVRWL